MLYVYITAAGEAAQGHFPDSVLHAYAYTPTLTRLLLLLHAYSYTSTLTHTPTLTRLLLHAYSYTPTRTRLRLHVYAYTPTLTRLYITAAGEATQEHFGGRAKSKGQNRQTSQCVCGGDFKKT
jgi:hypothetical protein